MEENNIVTTRRRRLRELITSKYGGRQAALVSETGINQGELSGLLKSKSFGEKKARSLEKQLGLPSMWLDSDTAILEDAEVSAATAEFSAAYRDVTPEGRMWMRNSVKAALSIYRKADRRQHEITPLVDRRKP